MMHMQTGIVKTTLGFELHLFIILRLNQYWGACIATHHSLGDNSDRNPIHFRSLAAAVFAPA